MGNKDRWFIGQFIKSYEAKANRALKVIGVFLVGDAKLRCVVGTPESTGIKGYVGGNLKNSITDDYEYLVAGVGSVVKYAPHVELGTEKKEARPFLKPALDENHADIQKLFTKMMGT